jgi:hypothetical protein
VSATHQYDRSGNYAIVVTVHDAVTGASVSATSTAQVALAPLNLTGRNFSVTGKKVFSGTVATFTDTDPRIDPTFYKATITWDDGSVSTGTINGTNPFTVTASHTFGTFLDTHLITVVVTDKIGRKASVVDRVDDPDALTAANPAPVTSGTSTPGSGTTTTPPPVTPPPPTTTGGGAEIKKPTHVTTGHTKSRKQPAAQHHKTPHPAGPRVHQPAVPKKSAKVKTTPFEGTRFAPKQA